MSKHVTMSTEERSALLTALAKRYPNEGEPSIDLSGRNPFTGTARYHHAYGTNSAIFKFTMGDRFRASDLYIVRDWND